MKTTTLPVTTSGLSTIVEEDARKQGAKFGRVALREEEPRDRDTAASYWQCESCTVGYPYLSGADSAQAFEIFFRAFKAAR